MKNKIVFRVKGQDVFVSGYPELNGKTGRLLDKDIALFRGNGWRSYELFFANIVTGKIRQMSDDDGNVLVNDSEIDYELIDKVCLHGAIFAHRKIMVYGEMNSWDLKFKNGITAIIWTLYPDGQYFADEDGYGAENNREERVVAIMDTNLNIIEPFRPIEDIGEYLNNLRSRQQAIKVQNAKTNKSYIKKVLDTILNVIKR